LRGVYESCLCSWRCARLAVFLALEVLLPLVFEQSKIFIHFVQSIVLSVERMNYIVRRHVHLVINVHVFFNELNEFLHLFAEKQINLVSELVA